MKKNLLITIGSLLAVAAIFIAGYCLHNPTIQKTEAAAPQEAVSLADAIAKDIESFKKGQALVQQGNDLMNRSSLSAKGKDLQLCADFKMIYSRTAKKLVPTDNCSDSPATFQ